MKIKNVITLEQLKEAYVEEYRLVVATAPRGSTPIGRRYGASFEGWKCSPNYGDGG